jgi:hypothetical protein
LFEVSIDWKNHARDVPLHLAAAISVSSFSINICSGDFAKYDFKEECIPQPAAGAAPLAPMSGLLMSRLQYRHFGGYETIVGTQTIRADSMQAAPRWFEIRRMPGASWGVDPSRPADPPKPYQEGTFAPDDDSRFNGSIAMDSQGNMALGYTKSTDTAPPSIMVAIRTPVDPLSTFGDEATIRAGGGSQLNGLGGGRWGDYSSMEVDPATACTFWYANEYFESDGTVASTWITRVVIPSCASGPDIGVPVNPTVLPSFNDVQRNGISR